ncbi:MAG: prepilin-type N-terminal cleavage/methylation domain-containing protein [Chloroflexi bacterium]|nr:prepilin-type N-terminal cleavage/methylation domain-containing protein [Chloroflexota bacterium]
MSLSGHIKKAVFSCGDRRGFTLIEVLVAMAVGAIVVVGASQVLQQVLFLVPKAETSMLAMRQVQFAGHWIDRDGIQAQYISPSDNLSHNLSTTPLVFSSVNWDSDNKTVTYSVDTNRNLQRQEIVKNKSAVIISSSQMQVADSITSLTAICKAPVGNVRKILTITIIAQVGGASATRTYQIQSRSL